MSDSLTFDAGLLARGWLATSLASGTDDSIPILCGTLLIESYPEGVRLAATDRYMALTTWVRASSGGVDDMPLDVAPDSSVVVCDPDGRGKALLTYLRKVSTKAAKDDLPLPQIVLHLGVPADDGDEPGFPGMERLQVVIDYPEHEKLALPIVQGEFPAFRTLLVEQKSKAIPNLAFGADILLRLAQAAKVVGGFLKCEFSGPDGSVAVEVESVDGAVVRGVAMPVRLAEIEAAA